MKKTLTLILIYLALSTNPGFAKPPGNGNASQAVAASSIPDSKTMEGDLQRLPWKQFRSVVEAVPKLKADVEAYGTFGWKYVMANYTTYGWKKNIDKLDDVQKKQLATLIQKAKATK